MFKFGRNYSFTISKKDPKAFLPLVVKPPFTLEFNISKKNMASPNNASFRITNLNRASRESIHKDQQLFDLNRFCILQAGYGDGLSTIFAGNITYCQSVREGTEFITTIECYDGGFAFVNSLVPNGIAAIEGMPIKTYIITILSTLASYGVQLGAVGEVKGNLNRTPTPHHNAIEEIKHYLGTDGFYIDNMKAYYLNDNEVVATPPFIIDSSVGLLGTPTRQDSFLNFSILFEPRIIMGQQITLKSTTNPQWDGNYKVTGLSHKGIISGSVCGEAVTSISVIAGVFNPVTPL